MLETQPGRREKHASPGRNDEQDGNMIEIIHECDGGGIAFRIGGRFTPRDYDTVWVPKLQQCLDDHGRIRAVLYMDESFQGWEFGAVLRDLRFGLKNRRRFHKYAVVGGPWWARAITAFTTRLIPGQVRPFAGDRLDEALAWIAE